MPQSVARRLFDLAAPIVGVNVLNVMALVIDTAMLGRLDNATTVLTSLGFAIQLVFLLMILMIGLTVGTVALIARAHGAGDHARVNHVLLQSTMLTTLLGIGVAIAGNLSAPYLLRAMGASTGAIQHGLDYLRPLLTGTVFSYLVILYGAVMRGVGNTRLPFLVAVVATGVNVGLNSLLIYGNLGFPALGIQGAALGTVASQFVGAAILGLLLWRGAVGSARLSLRPQPIDPALTRELLRVGAPAAMDMLLLNAGLLTIIGMLGRIDEVTVAAHGIGMRIQSLAFVPGLGISQATGAMVGQALGSGDAAQARAVVRASLRLCISIMTVLALLIVMADHSIVSLFDVPAGSSLESYTVQWIRLLGYTMPVAGWHVALAGLLQGAGATGTSLRINLVTTLVCQVPLAAVLGFVLDLGALGVWASFPISVALKALLSHRAYSGGRWAKVGIHA